MRLFHYTAIGLCAMACIGMQGIAGAQGAVAPAHTRAHEAVGPTVAEQASNHYRFETHTLTSRDGRRRYRVQLGIPKKSIPGTTRAALYMLDGNAAIDTLTAADLEYLANRNAPVLVAIGYDVSTRNDVVSRAYDYTPPVFQNGRQIAEPTVRGRVGGGANLFLQLIEEEIKPLLQKRASSVEREYLWGHSYGGLFTLHVLFTKPESFAGYIAGDPSAWWHNGALIDEWDSFPRERAAGKLVSILVGTKPRPVDRPAPPDADGITRDGKKIDARAWMHDVAANLGEHGAQVRYETFPQYGHGDMIRASLEHALEVASEPTQDAVRPAGNLRRP